MQIVIDIDEYDYKNLMLYKNHPVGLHWLEQKVIAGTPLPKGHGELIERDKLEYLKAIHDAKYGYISWGDASKLIKYSAPTIIEADKAERSEDAT